MNAGHGIRTDLFVGTRRKLFGILHKPSPDNPAARYVNYVLAALIVFNCAAVALETLPDLHARYEAYFIALESLSTAVFVVEYLCRVWCCVEQERLKAPVLGRLRYMCQPLPVLDFIVIACLLSPIDLRFLRVFRLSRLLRVLRLDDFDRTLKAVIQAISKRKTMMLMSVAMMLIAIYCSAAVLYMVEHRAQPNKFDSIPGTLWWAVETLTTIGYGDMYPITKLGKFLAAVLAIVGVGVFALPTAIITASILDAAHNVDHAAPCPHCGKDRHEVK